MGVRASAWIDRIRASLFFVPMLAVILAIGFGAAGLAVDRRLDSGSADLPLGLISTVESARALLSTIAAATITFAGIAFSISLLIIQLASSQYSPRVVHTLFRDPYNKRVMALVVGTFTYCLVLLRSVRSPLDDGGSAVIPNLSVMVATLLGISTILAIVAFINHSAHAMDVSEILDRVRNETVTQVRREWTPREDGAPAGRSSGAPISPGVDDPKTVVRFDCSGWFQQYDVGALLGSLEDDSVMELCSYPGRYAVEGTPLCTVHPPPQDLEATDKAIREAIGVGTTRSMQQDASYGLRQLADVALKALSPGINDPTTAQDAIFHAAAVLAVAFQHDPPADHHVDDRGRRLHLPHRPTHAELVCLAFEETRRVAAGSPTVCIYLLEAMHLVWEPLDEASPADGREAIVEQARLVLEGCEAADLVAADLAAVRGTYAKRFGASAGR